MKDEMKLSEFAELLRTKFKNDVVTLVDIKVILEEIEYPDQSSYDAIEMIVATEVFNKRMNE